MTKLALWVVCRACGTYFDTRLRMDERSFRRGTLAVNYHACPHCGVRETYRKAGYELRPVVDEGGRREPPGPTGEPRPRGE